MRKIFYLLMTVILAFPLTGCGEEDHSLENNSLNIISSNVQFEAGRGTGTVVVVTNGELETLCDADWCTITRNGNIVTVEVEPNKALLGRNAVLTIMDGKKKASVNISQKGLRLSVDKNQIVFSAGGGLASINYYTNTDVEFSLLEGGEGWLDRNIGNGNISFTAQSLGANLHGVRTARMSVSCVIGDGQTLTEELTIIQSNPISYENYLGDWVARFIYNDGVQRTLNFTLEEKVPGVSFYMNMFTGSFDQPTLTYDPVTGNLIVEAGQILQVVEVLVTTIDVTLCLAKYNDDGQGGGSWFYTRNPQVRMICRINEFAPIDQLSMTFRDEEMITGQELDTIWVGMVVMGSVEPRNSHYLTNLTFSKS